MTAFFTKPDGAFARVETLEFRTALAIARDGSEQRVATRAHPRLSLSETYYLKPTDLPALALVRKFEVFSKPMPHLAGIRDSLHFSQPLGVVRPFTKFAKLSESGAYSIADTNAAGKTPSPGFVAAWPALDMQLSATSSALESITHTFHRIQLTLESVSPVAAFSPVSEPVYPLPAPLFLKHNFSVALKDLAVSDVDSFDAGFVREKTVRYEKKSQQIELTLFSAAQIAEFRLFVCALRGACGSFLWTPPGGLEPKLWRLGSDVVSISHLRTNHATVQLTVVEL
ncbi:hypothetical protein DZC30_02340 [Comamonas testosteroni]|uniref:Uncharacterized protein n=1 Tax=Comamonas testosteroni TaxID=285 RepID=A0A373FT44_COMTE|nr:hypothetical protein [Comamonas testosteroni]RGE46635.1 hypothetical protein DZC30_02340 [Comamonas testosteroni]